jgi:hypothetical protein
MTRATLNDYKHPQIRAGDIIQRKASAVLHKGIVQSYSPEIPDEPAYLVLRLVREDMSSISGTWRDFVVIDLSNGKTTEIGIYERDVWEVLA